MTLHTAWTAAPLLILIAGLGLQVSWLRITGAGRRDEAGFTRWQRAHGNAVEHVPFAVLGLFLLEFAGARPAVVLGVGVALVVARLLHALGTGLRQRRSKVAGASLTYAVELALGVLLFVEVAF